MSSYQLNDLGPDELKQHTEQVLSEARDAVARAETRAAIAAVADEATPMDAREEIKAAVVAASALGAASTAAHWAARHAPFSVVAPPRATAIANLDILHRQQMMGDWSDDINEAYIQDRIYETRPDVIKAKKDKEAQMIKAKKETKEHMGSMLGDWDKAGKLIKRHTSKNRKKTKRRKQKIAKRIKGTKRR